MLQDPKSAIWCTGILLHIVQTSTLYQDAKTFVYVHSNRNTASARHTRHDRDLPARGDPDAIAKQFAQQLGTRKTMPVQELQAFIEKHFEEAGWCGLIDEAWKHDGEPPQ